MPRSVFTYLKYGDVAQGLERCLHKAEVGGSIPPIATKLDSGLSWVFLFAIINLDLKLYLPMKKLLISLALPLLTGFAGSFFTMNSIPTWYATLNRPELAPPNWIFGPVWTTLYLLMGYACYLIWKSNHKQKKQALTLYGIQLGLNAIWSPIFFGAQNFAYSLGVIALLDLTVIATMISFSKINKKASMLLLPYLAWILFASYLNYQFFILN